MSDEVSVRLLNRLDEIPRLTQVVGAFAAAHHLSDDVVFALTLSLDEIVTNVVSHAYDDANEHAIDVRLRFANGAVQARVEDDGRAFNPLDVPPPDLDTPLEQRPVGGLGLHLVRSTMDTVEYSRVGDRNVLTLTRRV